MARRSTLTTLPLSPAAAGSAGPRCVAIIADGSGRWAGRRGLPVADGHAAAADTLAARIADAVELGVEELAVYVFSTENWSRPNGEVRALMAMFSQRIARERPVLHRQGVSVRFIGRREGLSAELLEQMQRMQSLTERNTGLRLFLAFNYGGRAEIVDAARSFDGSSEADFAALLYEPDMHDPEIIIRTGGEQRLSNYLLWQSAYSELVFREELWPDFTQASYEETRLEYRDPARPFGGR